jgi:two-component system, LytTR family, sensor kinase
MTKQRFTHHVLFWLAYYSWSVIVSASYDYVFFRAFMSEAVNLPLKIVSTYFILYYLLPRYFRKKKYKQFFLYFLLVILCGAFIFRITQGFLILPLLYEERPFTPWDLGRYLWSVFELFSVAAIALSIKIFKMKYEQDSKEQELQKEKLQAELNFLKAQINPHFLFNTLNNIYGLALKNSAQTPEAILKLSELLRFIVYDGSSETIPIEHEVKLLEDYIELEKLRYGERLCISFDKRIDDAGQRLSPLILLPFIENSFKHGAGGARFNAFIAMDLHLHDGLLLFSVTNSKNNGDSFTDGLGLKNIKRQLELTYGVHHRLAIQNSGDRFSVDLQVNLKDHAAAQLSYH